MANKKIKMIRVVQLGFDVACTQEGLEDLDNLLSCIEENINDYYDITQSKHNHYVCGCGINEIHHAYEDNMKEVNKHANS
jgi:hypothetical protein